MLERTKRKRKFVKRQIIDAVMNNSDEENCTKSMSSDGQEKEEKEGLE